MSIKDNKKLSDELKSKGNKCFSEGNYEESIRWYSKAIEADPSNSVLYSNRAIAHIKLNNYFNAENDCSLALGLNASSDKALYRRGLARKELQMYKSALKDFEDALKISPNNSEIQRECNQLKRLLNNNNSKIKILPIRKGKQFKSSQPLQQIPIENSNELAAEDGIDSILSSKMIQFVTSKPSPENYSQFEYDWRQLSSSPINHKVEYLERIDVSALKTIFQFPLDPQMISELIETLHHSTNHLFVWQTLQFLSSMPRFELNLSFLSDDEFKVLRKIFATILKSNQVNPDQVSSLAKVFNVKIE